MDNRKQTTQQSGNSYRCGSQLFTLGAMVVLFAGVVLMSNSFVLAKDGPPSLKTVRVPLPKKLNKFIKNMDAANRLGKALYWDLQLGSDGMTACATCHFKAGVDGRSGNATVHPGFNGVVNTVLPLDLTDFPFNKNGNDDIIGSQGVRFETFLGVSGISKDTCSGPVPGANRQVTGRQAPNMQGAIFNRLNFWDGRAHEIFNGVNGNGKKDSAKIWVKRGSGVRQQRIRIRPASQSSQASGPPNNNVEMACDGRNWGHLGRKMYALRALAEQTVHPNDSALGSLANPNGKGLTVTYDQMVKAAFKDKYLSDVVLPFFPNRGDQNVDGITAKEANFSLIFSLALNVHAATIVPDDTRYDRAVERRGPSLTEDEEEGLEIFLGKGRCDKCHGGPEFTNAAITNGGNGQAFTNAATLPDANDQGRGKGEFKTPHLRNVEITGPFFHTGGYVTLRQVVDFYDEGGAHPGPNTDSQVRDLGLDDEEKDQLVSFLLTLTDDRARCEKAPFDRPEFKVVESNRGGDIITTLPAVGAGGRKNCLKPYLWNGDRDFHFEP